MPDDTTPTEYQLPLTGRRDGRYKRLIGYARVLDDEFTRQILAKKAWHLSNRYPATNVPVPDGRQKRLFLHRLVHEHYHGPIPTGHEIDHIGRIRTNATPLNIRAVTRSVNSANKGRRRDCTSGYTGVMEDEKPGFWFARISKDGKPIYLGSYPDKHEAARRVNAAYREHFPEVAIPNPAAEAA